MRSKTNKINVVLWVLQILLGGLFLFAGFMKLTIPLDALAQQSKLPVSFMLFIAIAEVLGGFGVILPGLLRRRRALTPLAATGLGIIMIGATALSAANFGAAAALFPLITGVVAAIVAYGRWDALAVAH